MGLSSLRLHKSLFQARRNNYSNKGMLHKLCYLTQFRYIVYFWKRDRERWWWWWWQWNYMMSLSNKNSTWDNNNVHKALCFAMCNQVKSVSIYLLERVLWCLSNPRKYMHNVVGHGWSFGGTSLNAMHHCSKISI